MDNGVNRDLPWASVFEPGANLRAFSAVQAEGLRAASKIVDRFVQAAAAGLNSTPGSAGGVPNHQDQRADLWGATDIAPLLTSWWAMVNQLVGGAGRPASSNEPAAVDISAGSASGQLALAAAAGGHASADLWLHNRARNDAPDAALRCSALSSPAGPVIGPDEVDIVPRVVSMPRLSSRGVEVSVRVRAEVEPGSYHGRLWVDGRHDLGVAVVLDVHPLP